MVSIALAPQCILQYKLINIFSIKCYFRANLKIDVAKNRIFWCISWVKLKSEIHSPGNFLLIKPVLTFGSDTLEDAQDAMIYAFSLQTSKNNG